MTISIVARLACAVAIVVSITAQRTSVLAQQRSDRGQIFCWQIRRMLLTRLRNLRLPASSRPLRDMPSPPRHSSRSQTVRRSPLA